MSGSPWLTEIRLPLLVTCILTFAPSIAYGQDRPPVSADDLEEVMTQASSNHDPFTRVAVFSYNQVSDRYEYFSIDPRAPQMMTEESGLGRVIEGRQTARLYLTPQEGENRREFLAFEYVYARR